VDSQNSSRLGTGRWLWLIENDAHPSVAMWQSTADCDVLEASHDGYARLPHPVLHTRRITLDKRKPALVIEDRLTGQGEHLVELFLHPAVWFEHIDNAVRLEAPNTDVWLLPPDGTTLREETGWISRGYGLKETATVLVYSLRGHVPVHLRTDIVLVPRGTRVDAARSLVGRL
jgi:uncharacterized heparinase superfamily protein